MALARTLRVIRKVRAPVSLIRTFAKKAEAGEGNTGSALSNADITKYFLDLDAATPSAATADLPVKLTGRSGELVQDLYTSAGKSKAAFDKITKELQGIVAAINNAGMVVDRFFSSTNYSPEECKLVAELLLTTKEPLTTFEGIKNADIKDLLVDNESNMDTWRNARKAIAAANPSAEVKKVFEALAEEARLDLVKKVAEKALDLQAAAAKTVEAVVSSAVALSKEQQATIIKALPQYSAAGSSLNVSFTVDPAVMGGLLVTLKNQTIDLTASSRLVEVMAAQRK